MLVPTRATRRLHNLSGVVSVSINNLTKQTLVVLSGNADRGWNDPPMFLHCAQLDGQSVQPPKKRPGLTKRVAHPGISGPTQPAGRCADLTGFITLGCYWVQAMTASIPRSFLVWLLKTSLVAHARVVDHLLPPPNCISINFQFMLSPVVVQFIFESVYIFERTISSGSLFHGATILLEKVLALLRVLLNSLYSLYLCPLVMFSFAKLKIRPGSLS